MLFENTLRLPNPTALRETDSPTKGLMGTDDIHHSAGELDHRIGSLYHSGDGEVDVRT